MQILGEKKPKLLPPYIHKETDTYRFRLPILEPYGHWVGIRKGTSACMCIYTDVCVDVNARLCVCARAWQPIFSPIKLSPFKAMD